MRVLATPDQVCQCGHVKAVHAWLRSDDAAADTPMVEFKGCGYGDFACGCMNYSEVTNAVE